MALLLGAGTLLGAPGLTARSKKLLGNEAPKTDLYEVWEIESRVREHDRRPLGEN